MGIIEKHESCIRVNNPAKPSWRAVQQQTDPVGLAGGINLHDNEA